MKLYVTVALTAIVGVLGLTACYHTNKVRVDVAHDACEVNAIAEEHKSLTQRVEKLEIETSERETDERWTILLEKLKQYRAEVDASYRFVTSSCRNYNMCLQANGFDDYRCRDLRQAWSQSQVQFNDLAVKLAQIEKPVVAPNPTPRDGGTKDRCRSGRCPADNCNVEGSVFTTSCNRRD